VALFLAAFGLIKLGQVTGAPKTLNSAAVAGLPMQIPYSTEHGIISAEQGILTKEQGILPAKSDIIAA
jgi:hypothetical protein